MVRIGVVGNLADEDESSNTVGCKFINFELTFFLYIEMGKSKSKSRGETSQRKE